MERREPERKTAKKIVRTRNKSSHDVVMETHREGRPHRADCGDQRVGRRKEGERAGSTEHFGVARMAVDGLRRMVFYCYSKTVLTRASLPLITLMSHREIDVIVNIFTY